LTKIAIYSCIIFAYGFDLLAGNQAPLKFEICAFHELKGIIFRHFSIGDRPNARKLSIKSLILLGFVRNTNKLSTGLLLTCALFTFPNLRLTTPISYRGLITGESKQMRV